VTGPVRPPTPQDQAWAELAAELTPAKTLARIDTVTARAITTITVVGVLLTGLGAASAALPAQPGAARALAAAAAITAALAVAAALTAQVLTITRRLNPANLADVKAWYRRQFELRAYPAQAATALLLLSALLAGASAASTLLAGSVNTPALTITQVSGPGSVPAVQQQATVTASVTFGGLAPGQPATVILTAPGAAGTLARAAVTAAPNGTAAVTLTARPSAAQSVVVTAVDPHQTCQATFSFTQTQPVLSCHAR
jgi:hypothetical protein